MPAATEPMSIEEMISFLSGTPHAGAVALHKAIGGMYDQDPKRIPDGFEPDKLLRYLRVHDRLFYNEEGDVVVA